MAQNNKFILVLGNLFHGFFINLGVRVGFAALFSFLLSLLESSLIFKAYQSRFVHEEECSVEING